MKTIEEAAKEYTDSLKLDGCHYASKELFEEYAEADFKAGVEFAQRWIPIEEELPKNIEIFWKGEFEYDKGYLDFRESTFAEIKHLIKCTALTHWRPIELK